MFTTKAYTRLERKIREGGDNDDKFELNKSMFFFALSIVLNRVTIVLVTLESVT